MKFKLTTFVIVLSLCIAITGCFKNPAEEAEKNISICQNKMYKLYDVCEIYASKNEGKFPNRLYQLKQKGYIEEIPKCPIDVTEYKFLSKYVKNGDKEINCYIIYCPKHDTMIDSVIGDSAFCYLYDTPTYKNPTKEEIKNGIISISKDGKVIDEITLTDEELKQLGLK